jgi:hyaluronan synthase
MTSSSSGSARCGVQGYMASRWRGPLVLLSLIACTVWVAHRLDMLVAWFRSGGDPFATLFGFVCLFFVWQLLLAWRERPTNPTLEADRQRLAGLTICINIPCYNEDPALLNRALGEIFSQTRLPDRVEVVDDGSTVDYRELRDFWEEHVPAQVAFAWRRLDENRGKRHAQMETFRRASEDIFVTVDSDTVLDRHALEEGVKPFVRDDVQSVAGLVLGLNKHRNFITRLEDLVFTSTQLTMRSAYAHIGNVTVNSGAFALYRREVISDHATGYVSETILGRRVQLSDDSLLTLYALVRGRTVQQTSAIAFTHWPETWSHHVRQQVRWMRGSTLRTFWRARYLPLKRPAFWLSMIGMAQFLAITALLVYLIGFMPEMLTRHLELTIPAVCALSYVAMIRSLTVGRSDETAAQKLLTYALSPLGMLWMIVVSRLLRLYGMATVTHTSWGTRATVESPAG